MIQISNSRFTVILLLLCVIDPSLFSLSRAEGLLQAGIFQNTPFFLREKTAVIDGYINWLTTDTLPVSHLPSATEHSLDEAQHYWITAKFILFSMLIVLSIGLGISLMAIWIYLSFSRLNRELSASIKKQRQAEHDLLKSQAFLLEVLKMGHLRRWQFDFATNNMS